MKMTTEELAELFLAHLNELANEAPHPNFLFSVNDFAPKLGITDRDELQKALNYLGDRGFIILASFDMTGGISAGITMEGSIFVERGGETGAIKQFHKNLQPTVRNHSKPSPPVIDQARTETMNGEKKASFFACRSIEAILDDIEDVLKRDDSVSDEGNKDLLYDLATLKIQIERNVKNRQIFNVVLDNLSRIPSIAPLVNGLSCIVEAYFR